jgi:hypothetical protein
VTNIVHIFINGEKTFDLAMVAMRNYILITSFEDLKFDHPTDRHQLARSTTEHK